MKFYRVYTIPAVHLSILDSYEYIAEESPQAALDWLSGIKEAIKSLEHLPQRCGFIREQDAFQNEIRELRFQSFRIIFQISESDSLVEVLALRHAAQDSWKDGGKN
ncbi:MAG: hypothetical protein COA78_20070 [Blastopirellula sp.]|nr:MAG: hypothetical protein COA78_20070 [Blastopirellula sp.]